MNVVIDKVRKHLTPEEIRILDDGLDALLCQAEDGCYYKCIMDGSWPTAVEILEVVLANAKEKRAKGEAEHGK